MNQKSFCSFLLLACLIVSGPAVASPKHGRNIKIVTPTQKISLSAKEMNSLSKQIEEKSANYPGQRSISLKNLFEAKKIAPGTDLVFFDAQGHQVNVPSGEALATDSSLALVSTFHGQWKLVRTAGNASKESPYLLRSLAAIEVIDKTQAKSAVEMVTKVETTCADRQVYYSVAEALKHKNTACVLNLSGQSLKTLPTEIYALENLEELFLSRNQMTELPPRIRELKKLRVMVAGRNQIKNLPKEIGGLENLVILKLGRNQIGELPIEIGALKKVHKLELDHNQLRNLPPEISKMTSLRELELAANPVEDLPDSLAEMKSLQEIELDTARFSPEKRKQLAARFPSVKIEWED